MRLSISCKQGLQKQGILLVYLKMNLEINKLCTKIFSFSSNPPPKNLKKTLKSFIEMYRAKNDCIPEKISVFFNNFVYRKEIGFFHKLNKCVTSTGCCKIIYLYLLNFPLTFNWLDKH